MENKRKELDREVEQFKFMKAVSSVIYEHRPLTAEFIYDRFSNMVGQMGLSIASNIDFYLKMKKYKLEDDDDLKIPSSLERAFKKTTGNPLPAPKKEREVPIQGRDEDLDKQSSQDSDKVSKKPKGRLVLSTPNSVNYLKFFNLKKDEINGNPFTHQKKVAQANGWKGRELRDSFLLKYAAEKDQVPYKMMLAGCFEFRLCAGKFPNDENCLRIEKGKGSNISSHAKKFHKQFCIGRNPATSNKEAWIKANDPKLATRQPMASSQQHKWNNKYANDRICGRKWQSQGHADTFALRNFLQLLPVHFCWRAPSTMHFLLVRSSFYS